jgi:hypothetical protein
VGITYYSMDEVDDIVVYFGNFWYGSDYDPFSQNCNAFAEKFLSHLADKEQFYFPSYINRFTKLGSVLRGWFKPLQTLFGEVVELDHEGLEAQHDDFGYEMADAADYMPVVGVAAPVKQKPEAPPANQPGFGIGEGASGAHSGQHEGSVPMSPSHAQAAGMHTGSARGANDRGIPSPPPREGRPETTAQHQTEAKNKLDALLASPKHNILVAQIIGMTQRDPSQPGHGMGHQGLNFAQSPRRQSDLEENVHARLARRTSATQLEAPAQNIINVDDPVERIKQRADELLALQQYQHAMKFFEICLGKITAVTDVDLAEDSYMMSLAIQTYLGICSCAHHLSLWDHLGHFASQCIQVDSANTSN